MFRISQLFRQTIKSFDVFKSPLNLRYKLESDYNTFAGGIVSVILFLLLVSVFFNSWVDLLSKNDINSSTEIIRETDPSSLSINSDDFMFTVGVQGMNLSDKTQSKYFDIKMAKYEITINSDGTSSKTSTTLKLEPCTASHWSQLGESFVDTFNRQKLSGFLCVPRNTTIQVEGKYTSEKFVYYKLQFQKCVGNSYCRTQKQIDDWVVANSAFYFNFYYSNTLLNPDQQDSITNFFQDRDYMMFSPTMAVSTNLYLGEYELETDESLFPWGNKIVQSGFIINRAEKQSWNYMSTPHQPYCKFYIRKSNTKYDMQKKYRKIDDMFSYIGGLFGIISVAVGFVMNYYSQCSFELEMCQQIFDYENGKSKKNTIKQSQGTQSKFVSQSSELSRQSKSFSEEQSESSLQNSSHQIIHPGDFGFFDFILQILVYIPIRKLFKIKWKRMQIYEESLEEMRYKLDISQLLEKLAFYDRSINALFDHNQLKLLYLQQKFNFQEVREQRKMLSMRKDIVANLFGLIREDQSIEDEIKQRKKSLDEIASRRNRSRIETFIGVPSIHSFERAPTLTFKGTQKKQEEVNLPPDIKTALRKLDSKIDSKDLVSIRIYNGLQFELLEAFQRSKMKTNSYCVTAKKIGSRRRIRIKDLEGDEFKERKKYPISFTEFGFGQELESINSLDSKEKLPDN